MDMEPTILGAIIVAVITGLSAYASQKAISKASTITAITSSRTDMEREAYIRARDYDTETIKRLDDDLDQLREENEELQIKIRALISHIIKLEEARGLYPGYPPEPPKKEIE